MEFKLKEHSKNRKFSEFVLGGDIGGTNTNLAIAGVKNNKPELLFSLHYQTKKLANLRAAIRHALDYAKSKYSISIEKACMAVAGVVKGNSAELTNIKWDINTKEILSATTLKSIMLINDFEAIGYGLNILPNSDLLRLNNAAPQEKKAKAIIGAGTGLGKSILYFDEGSRLYIPLPTEGGHEDFPAQNEEELELVRYIQKLERTKKAVSYELLLSGPGLERIYSFVKARRGSTKTTDRIDNSSEKPKLISEYAKKDKVCNESLRIFAKIYGRAVKNFALETLCFGGMYIGGGIAVKNPEIFKMAEFKDEIKNHLKMENVLKKIPLFLIKNYDVSLYGACLASVIK